MQTKTGEENNKSSLVFHTDYQSILEKVQGINPIRYAKTRNFLTGDVSYLSPYISRGVISVKQIKEIVLANGYKQHESEKFFQELAWREYFQRVWQAKGNLIWQDLKQSQPDTKHSQMITALHQATTGISIIDEQINLLYASGYLHNHVRMYIASIACNIGKAHWLKPSKWLYYHLLDGDIASNNSSWQWVAGAFSSKKYYCNQENINTYTNSDQRNSFLDKPYEALPGMHVPDALTETCSLDLQTTLPVTSFSIIDTSIPSLLYNSYNLDPLWRKDEQANRILLLEPSHFSEYPVSKKVIEFIIGLSNNITGIQVFAGEVRELEKLYEGSAMDINKAFISKEHPAFEHYPGTKDSRDWMYPQVNGYYPSFSGYWKQCVRYVRSM